MSKPTREEILAMPPGEDMDRLVARVYGLEVKPFGYWHEAANVFIPAEEWTPSANVAHAFQVCDWISLHDRTYWTLWSNGPLSYRFDIITDGEGPLCCASPYSVRVEGPDIALCVCRAVLLATLDWE